MSLIVFAFHYNRGRFLQNLVRSVARHVPAPLIIFDDGSTDSESLKILDGLAAVYEVVRSRNEPGDVNTGGLHANMTHALEIAESRGVELALMVQDDMQIVRDVTLADLDLVRAGFACPKASFVIHSSFMKANYGKLLDDKTMVERTPGIYERNLSPRLSTSPDAEAVSYSDTGFFSVALYRQYAQRLIPGENANQVLASARGLRLGFMSDPVMHWLPMPTSFHNRRRRMVSQVIDRIAGAGVHPIAAVSDKKPRESGDMNSAGVPYAEDNLISPTLPPVRYWSLHGGLDNLRSRAGWRGRLGELIVRAKSAIQQS